MKGGDAYGQIPKRIAMAMSQGEEKVAWPGQEAVLNVVPRFHRGAGAQSGHDPEGSRYRERAA